MGVHVCAHRGVDYNRPLGLNKKNAHTSGAENLLALLAAPPWRAQPLSSLSPLRSRLSVPHLEVLSAPLPAGHLMGCLQKRHC